MVYPKRKGVVMTIGIYCIKNNVNGKIYVGQSINIERRIITHKRSIKSCDISKSRTNINVLYDAIKHGEDVFEFNVLEICSKDMLYRREKHWIFFYEEKGVVLYNKRTDCKGYQNPNKDNSWSDEQRLKMSEIKKQQHLSGNIYNDEWKTKISKTSSNLWKDELKKSEMAKKVGLIKEKYIFTQMTKNGDIVRVWQSMREIIAENSEYHIQSIYSVCSGYKKSYKGFKWSKQLKI